MTTKRLLAALGGSLLVTGVGIAACSGSSTPEAPDTGPVADAAVERDAAADARGGDAFADANPDSGQLFPGEWLKVPGVPSDCELYYAKDPAVAAPPFPWKACPSGRQDCKYFIGNWPHPSDRYFAIHPYHMMFEDALGVHISYLRHTVGPGPEELRETQSISVGQLVDGAGEFALRGRASVPSCTPTQFHAGRWGYSASVFQAFDLDASTPSVRMLVTADRATPQKLQTFMLDGKVGPALIQGVVAGDGYSILNQIGAGNPTSAVFRHADATYHPNANPPVGAELNTPVPGGYLAILGDVPPRLGFVPDGGVARTIVRAPEGRYVTFYSVDRKNGNSISWYEKDQETGELTLYSSPFATDEAGIVRRPVAKLARLAFGVANAGYFAYTVRENAMRVLRLSDGLGWDLEAEPGVPLMETIFVNESYVWNVVSFGRDDEARVRGGLIRMRLPSTPPTIPSGL